MNPVQQSVVERVAALAEPLAVSLGYELVDVEYAREGSRWVLRLFIDKPGGVSLEDCTAFSHAIGPQLDVEDVGEVGYALEVSSPGLDRPLRKPRDFERFAGQKARVRTFAPLRAAEALGERKSFSGTLLGFSNGRIELEVEGTRCEIPIERVAKANLIYDFQSN